LNLEAIRTRKEKTFKAILLSPPIVAALDVWVTVKCKGKVLCFQKTDLSKTLRCSNLIQTNQILNM